MSQGNRNDFPPPSAADEPLSEAARAIADWPLLAMLEAGRPGSAVSHGGAAGAMASVFVPPAPQPPAPSAAVMPDPVPAAEAAVAEPPAAEAPPRQPNQLEQLFNRADKSGQAPLVKRTVFKQSGPPPLKTAGQSGAAPGHGGAITIEPQPRQWRDLETVPGRLFDRAGGGR